MKPRARAVKYVFRWKIENIPKKSSIVSLLQPPVSVAANSKNFDHRSLKKVYL